ADKFETAFGADELFQRREHPRRIATRRDDESGRYRRVLHLESADQRKPDRISPPAMRDRYFLREAVDGAAHEPGVVALLADRQNFQVALLRGLDHLRRIAIVDADHRRAA